MLFKFRVPGFRLYRSAESLWSPLSDEMVPLRENCVIVMGREIRLAKNIVTEAGERFYAELVDRKNVVYPGGMTNLFGTHEAQTSRPIVTRASTRSVFDGAHITASQKDNDAGYPKRHDADPHNPTAGERVITHKVSYGAGSTVSDISGWIITNDTPAADEPILCGFSFAPFTKPASQGLELFVNHRIGGA